MLRVEGRWIWDFWTIGDGEDHHIFYLQAPRSLGDPELRHAHASVGHAVSRDLRRWTILPDALGPGEPGAWDDRAVWTGSALRVGDGWAMLYTGTCRAEGGAVQRVGLATSSDLLTWRRHPANPVLEADARWYERLPDRAWHEEAWRDPWLIRDPGTGLYRALLTARVATGPPDGRGVVAHASSRDLVDWEVHPPITDAGWYCHLEVPQVTRLGDRWYLIFSVEAERYSAAHPEPPVRAIRYRVADDPLGPYTAGTDKLLAGDGPGTRYAGKIVATNGRAHLLAFRCFDADGRFHGEIDDPVPLSVDGGRLHLRRNP